MLIGMGLRLSVNWSGRGLWQRDLDPANDMAKAWKSRVRAVDELHFVPVLPPL